MSGAIARRDFLRATGATVIVAGGFDGDSRTCRGRALVGGNGAAETQGAAERLRLPHAHLRQPLSGRPQRHAAAARRDRRRLSPASEADRHDAQRRRHALDLRHRQFLHARRDGQARRDRARRRGGRHERHRRRTQAAARPRRSRHPLQSRPVRRHHASTCSSRCRSASTISAGTSRSICWATPIVETADLLQRLPSPDRVRPYGAHSSTGRRRSSGFRSWC